MEDILSGVNGRRALLLVEKVFVDVLGLAPILRQKMTERHALNRTLDLLSKPKNATHRTVVRTQRNFLASERIAAEIAVEN